MAADLHIHVVDPIELEEDVRQSFRSNYSSNRGKKWVNIESQIKYDGKWYTQNELFDKFDDIEKEKVQDRREVVLKYDEQKVQGTDNVWIGEVSWLKAGLMGDSETFIPGPVQKVQDLIQDKLPTITEEFIEQVVEALKSQNTTSYDISKPKPVVEFLKKHLGKKVYTISW